MMQSRHFWKALWLVSSVVIMTGCGGGKDNRGDDSEDADGTVTDLWEGFCTGTFTEDTPIYSVFDEIMFTAQAGEEYLLAYFDDTFGDRAEFLYLTTRGPNSFEIEPNAEGGWPFTSNCAIGAGVPYYAVFTDVSIFAEEELTTKICDLSEGAVLPAGGSGRGYAIARFDGSFAIYEVILGPFSAECGDRDRGYIRVPQTRSFGSTTWLVPISGIIGPD